MRTSNSTVRTLTRIGVTCFCTFKRICKFITWIRIHNDFILYVSVFLLQTEVFTRLRFLSRYSTRYLAHLWYSCQPVWYGYLVWSSFLWYRYPSRRFLSSYFCTLLVTLWLLCRKPQSGGPVRVGSLRGTELTRGQQFFIFTLIE